LHAVHDSIVRAIDSGDVCALVLLDLSSAFDTVDHDTLLHVLNRRFGFDGQTITWFGSYLSNRTQAFHYNTQRSRAYTVDCSLPQASVLGPKEFIAYTEELAELIDSYRLVHHFYADDTQLMKNTRITDVSSTIQTLQQCIEAIHRWCTSRRLQLNPSKTEVIWLGTKANLMQMEHSDISLLVGNDVIEPASVVPDLGVLLDSELSLKKHVSKVASVCYFQLRRLKPIRRILGRQITSSLVNTFVLSRLDYFNAVLAGLPNVVFTRPADGPPDGPPGGGRG